jgi:hypothetical protein
LDTSPKIFDSNLSMLLRPAWRVDLHETSDLGFTAEKEMIQAFLDSSLAGFLLFVPLWT